MQSNSVPTKCRGHKRQKRTTSTWSLYGSTRVMNDMTRKAKAVQASLPKESPSFIKYMHPSQVQSHFWLGIPKEVRDKHMSMADQKFELEDENGRVYDVNYLASTRGLSSSGWREFSVDHNLVLGDVLVFQLVTPAKFKVYIVRKCASKVYAARDFVNSNDAIKPAHTEAVPRPLSAGKPEGENSATNRSSMEYDHNDNAGNGSSAGSECGTTAGSDGQNNNNNKFKQVKHIEDFKIVAKGTVINDELPKLTRLKYYELCRSQNSYLHALLDGLDNKLIAGNIAETVKVADAIRGFEAGSAGRGKFKFWRSKLKALKSWGMNVGFLFKRLEQLKYVSGKAKRYKKLRRERCAVEEEVQIMEARLWEAIGKMKQLDSEIEGLKVDGNGVEVAFKDAPW